VIAFNIPNKSLMACFNGFGHLQTSTICAKSPLRPTVVKPLVLLGFESPLLFRDGRS
jgi:hypothetical protein